MVVHMESQTLLRVEVLLSVDSVSTGNGLSGEAA